MTGKKLAIRLSGPFIARKEVVASLTPARGGPAVVRATAAASAREFIVHPSTQTAERLVTLDRLGEWGRELSNRGR
jgi:hypothetical protein